MKKDFVEYPLTYPQKSIWYLEKLYPGTGIGNISATLKVHERLDYELINRAINLLIARNESFWIHIKEEKGLPVQYLATPEEYKIDEFDFTKNSLEELYSWDKQQASVSFTLNDNHLFYFALIHIDENTSGIFTRIHHCIADAWSLTQIGSEILLYYRALKDDEPLPEGMNPSYREFIENEQLYLSSKRYQKDKLYWASQFDHVPEPTTLKPRISKDINLKANRKTYLLPEKLVNIIKSHCKENQTSIFSLFFAAISIYLNRVKGCNDITIGTPVLNRTNAIEKQTLGMFISTVPLRIKMDSGLDFVAFSRLVDKTWFAALRHQKYPYDCLLRDVRSSDKKIERLFDIALSYQNAKFSLIEGNVQTESRWHFNGFQAESLYLHINDHDDEGKILLNYDFLTDLFYEKEIEFLHDHLVRLLWHALDNPTRQLSHVHMLSAVELETVLHEFNQTDANYPRDLTVKDILESQAALHPDRIALSIEEQEISYRELNARANRLARILCNKNVGPEKIIALLMPRCLEMIVAILAVVKAGGAYLPIDPRYPIDRINYMLSDSNSHLLLTTENSSIKQGFCGEVLEIDENLSGYPEKMYESNLKTINTPGDLLYVIYTSGSTGLPKGVMIEHRNVVRLLINDMLQFRFGQEDVWTMFHSYCFDFSVWEMYGAFFYGGKLVMVSRETAQDTEKFIKLLQSEKVTVFNQTPAAFYNLVNLEKKIPETLLLLRYVIFGGEALKPSMLIPFRKRYPNTDLINMYGITETTVHVTFLKLSDDDLEKGLCNIGRPIPTMKTYILDHHLNPLPIGVPGELCVSGEGVGRGYLNNPSLTIEKFVPNPFSPGELLYRSGDLARYFPRGDMEYLGRIDSQVKIRGHRIELGEIEERLLAHPGVCEAVLITQETSNDTNQLVAYYVSDHQIEESYLRQFLEESLPDYMIPSFLIQLESIPLNGNGKVDRKSLPKPGIHRLLEYTLPRNKKEMTLASVWEAIFGIDHVGIDDNFFSIGGDSLSAVQFSALLEQNGYQVSLQDIYKYPTIRMLQNRLTPFQGEFTYPCFAASASTLKENVNIWNTIEHTSICQQILSGQRKKVDAAALIYLPNDAIDDVSRDSLSHIRKEQNDKPIMYQEIKLDWGSIGVIALPVTGNELYQDKSSLLRHLYDAIDLAGQLGAKVVSLTGLIPSATSYGMDIHHYCQERSLKTEITTGHTTTAASVILSLEKLLSDAQRSINLEKVGVLGLGSIGSTVIELALKLLPHPQSIMLCDLPNMKDHMVKLMKKLQTEYGFKGKISIVTTNVGEPPDPFYLNSLIIGATNVPDVLEIDKCQPGTLLIDDSGPHCFSKTEAIDRLQCSSDILFTEGGVLHSPHFINKSVFMPKEVSEVFIRRFAMQLMSSKEITGCILSSLLSAQKKHLKPKVGSVDINDCVLHFVELKKLGFQGAILHCDDYELPDNFINAFRELYKHNKSASISEQNDRRIRIAAGR